jgi:molybdopterin synthase catalytic subunit
MTAVTRPPRDVDEWLDLTPDPLAAGVALDWATLPRCGAVVTFTGTVRDHADGREGVSRLEYEAYHEQVLPKLREVAAAVRDRWPTVGRIALLHRVGMVALGEPSVLVVVSAPHRAEAFAAARHAIDTLKETVPIWKREFWDGGDGWGLDAHDVRPARDGSMAGSIPSGDRPRASIERER